MNERLITIRVARFARIEIAEQSEYYRQKAGHELAHRWRASVQEAINSL